MAEATLDVLVVEDDLEVATLVAEIVRSCGARARVAGDGATALRMLEEARPGLMFLDLDVPSVSGDDVARCVRAQYGERLPIVAMTGYVGERHESEAISAGCDHVLFKPMTWAAIEHAIRDAAAHR